MAMLNNHTFCCSGDVYPAHWPKVERKVVISLAQTPSENSVDRKNSTMKKGPENSSYSFLLLYYM